MNSKRGNTPDLRLISGGQDCQLSLNGLRVVAAPEKPAPFLVDAKAVEQDTYLVLGEVEEIGEPTESVSELAAEAARMLPHALGKVLIRHTRPLELHAVVHDFDREPSWNEDWVTSGLDAIFREVRHRHIRSLALPLIGTRHGKLPRQRFLELLRPRLNSVGSLHRLWLVVPRGSGAEILAGLQDGPSAEI